ncbi:MAG TPA: hypothetical protein PKU83_00115 [Chryseolinea sp.]|nr:hypothetical protein [Chryseolinea sp.]
MFLAVIIASANAWGQSASSPVSNFGIGEPYGNALIHNQGMGGVGVSQPQYWFANNQNPALLVFNRFTVFEAGIAGEQRKIKGDTISESNIGGTLNYLVTVFPVKVDRWTTSIGLMPFTNIDYGFSFDDVVRDHSTNIPIDSVPQSVINTGQGGLSQFYWSNGVRITPDMSVGVKAAYLFGSADYIYANTVNNTGQPIQYIVTTQEKTTVKDFAFSVGYSFSKDSLFKKQDYRLSFGAVYNFSSDLKGKKVTNFFSQNLSGDTVEFQNLAEIKGSVYIPSSITVGASISKGLQWTAGTEFTYQDWSGFKSVNSDNERGRGKQFKAAIGGEFTPDAQALESFFKRITYRIGGSIEQYPFLVNDKELKDFGINFGFSLPAGRSSVDLAFKVGKRGDRKVNAVEESYFKVYFGITFNDQWFVKRKFD